MLLVVVELLVELMLVWPVKFVHKLVLVLVNTEVLEVVLELDVLDEFVVFVVLDEFVVELEFVDVVVLELNAVRFNVTVVFVNAVVLLVDEVFDDDVDVGIGSTNAVVELLIVFVLLIVVLSVVFVLVVVLVCLNGIS